MTASSEGHDWRHGWVPLTLRAALQKAHGNHAQAEHLLGLARAKRRRRRARAQLFTTPHPAHQAQLAERRQLAALSDAQIADAMGTADDDTVERLLAELERRDKAERKAAAARERRGLRRHARETAREAEFDRLVAAGEDEQEAYRRAYGVTEDQQRRQEAAAALRSAGHRGKGFEELARSAYKDHADETYWKAEDATRGHMLNKEGRRAGIHPRTLFTGPDARARKYASEELLNYWQAHGRLSLEDFRAGLLGGRMHHTGAAAYA